MDETTVACAYTGETLVFERIEGSPLWRCLNGFNPAEWISGAHFEKLRKELMVRPGGKTARKLVCPYKGTPVTLIEHMGMLRAEGAFSPKKCVWLTRQEALWECSWRNGKAPSFPREFRITVGEELQPQSNPAAGILETADNYVEQMGQALAPP